MTVSVSFKLLHGKIYKQKMAHLNLKVLHHYMWQTSFYHVQKTQSENVEIRYKTRNCGLGISHLF